MTELIKVEDLLKSADKVKTLNKITLVSCAECVHYVPHTKLCHLLEMYREPNHLCTEGATE